MLAPGEKFPTFELQAHDGTIINSAGLKGTAFLIYFYPKADTPGCTKEACTFRDAWSDVKDAGIRIFGVSYDTPEANRAFAEKFNLPFLLLSDNQKALAKETGADRFLIPFPKRISYLVGPTGDILRAYSSVSPSNHAGDVLNDYHSFKDL